MQPPPPILPAADTLAHEVDAGSAAAQVMLTLPRVMDAMRLAMRSQIDGPLSVPQFRGLNFIDRQPGGSVSALAGFLGVTLATASAMADRLVKAGSAAWRSSPRSAPRCWRCMSRRASSCSAARPFGRALM